MTTKEKYIQVFTSTFEIETVDVNSLKYQDIDQWDSMGHLFLISNIEDTFEISVEMDDIIEFSSFEKGIEILSKYDLEF